MFGILKDRLGNSCHVKMFLFQAPRSSIGSLQPPNVGITEVLFDALEEFKRRISQTSEAQKSLDGIEALGIPEGASYLLYLCDGVPSRLVIDAQKAKPQQFVFSADLGSLGPSTMYHSGESSE